MMASHAVNPLNRYLMCSHKEFLILLLRGHHSQSVNINHHTINTARLPSVSASNSRRTPPPLHLVLRPFTIASGFYKQQSRKLLSQEEEISVFARYSTRKMGKAQMFDEKDRCAVFDGNRMLIKETTFARAKVLASDQNSRLVYKNKNADGLLCFSIQRLPGNTADPIPGKENVSRHFSGGKRDTKTVAKEYKINAGIAERDLKIKINQMQSHLSKGKQVILFIKETTSGSQTSGKEKGGSEKIKKVVAAELGDICKVNQDYSNATTTRLTLSLKPQVVPSVATIPSEEGKL